MRQVILCASLLCAVLSDLRAQSRGVQSQPAVADLESAPTLRLAQELRIGSASDPAIGFARIGIVEVDRDGNVYVFEGQERTIRVYSAAGQLLRSIGRAGTGPGEFGASIRFGVKGDTVWAVEGGVQVEVTLFDRRGTLLSTIRSDGVRVPGRGSSSLLFTPQFMRSDGTYLSGNHTVVSSRNAPSTGISPADTLRIPRILFASDGTPRDTLHRWADPPPEPARALRSVTSAAGNQHTAPRPPADRDFSVPISDGRFSIERRTPASATQATLRIVRENVTGAPVYARSYRYLPVRYTSQLLDSAAARSLRSTTMIIIDGAVQQPVSDTTAATRSLVRGAMSFPEFQVPVQAYFVGADASLMLRREDAIGTQRWDLLDPQGNPRGKLIIPANVRPAWLSGDMLWAVVPDADDVQFLVKYRISR